MKRICLIISLIVVLFQVRAADYYWVGGAGSWSELSHWRLDSSTGAIPSIVPAADDNVFFTANSGFGATVATSTVTLNVNAICKNMTWLNVPNAPRFVASSGSFTVEVWGNLVLSPVTIYNVQFVFKGAEATTLTTNDRVLGNMIINVDKAGGSVAVVDSLIRSSTGRIDIQVNSGTFDIAGKKVVATSFHSITDNVRTLEMTNAHVTIVGTGSFRSHGANNTVNAAGSYVESYVLYIHNSTFNKVVCNGGAGVNQIGIQSSNFSSLTFTHPAGSVVGIGNNTTVTDSLIFASVGGFGQNNNLGYVYFGKSGSIGGGNNVIRKIECKDNIEFAAGLNLTHVNTIDTLLLAPNRRAYLDGTLNINKYLYLAGAPCEAFTEVSGDSTNGVVNFAAGAVVDISNVLLTGVKATGPVTPIPITGIDGEGNDGFSITEPSTAGTTLYWVGGSGDWNDRSHWSTTSGGGGGACIPFINDDVVFDANSGFAPGDNIVTTTSSAFCHNMTWAAGVGAATFNESGAYLLSVYGSVVLQPSVTMNAVLEMQGTTNDTITTNGSTLGTLGFGARKTGSGTVILADNWTNAGTSGFQHYSGGLDLSGRTVSVQFYYSNINAVRSLDITDATLHFSGSWEYRGGGKSLLSTGSHITTSLGFLSDGLNYPWVDADYAGTTGVFNIVNTTFGQLTFNATGATVSAYIGSGNTIRRLEFKGRGMITGGGNTIDSLILAGSRNYFFGGSNTITKYFKAESPSCTGMAELRNYALAGTTGTLIFDPAADIHMNNVYMQNMTASGQNPAFNGADAGGNTGWNINVAAGGDRYWVGGGGDWNNPMHWSATSGGDPGTACIPTVFDNVYFDAGSGFTSDNRTVTINNGNAYCANIDWTGAANNPIFSKSASFEWEVWGDSVIINPATTLNVSYLTLKGSNETFIRGGAPAGNFDIRIDKTGGSLTFLDDYHNNGTIIAVTNGAFNAPGRTLTLEGVNNESLPNATSIDISNATITTGRWEYAGPEANHALNADNSVITVTTFAFIATGFTYNKVNTASTAVNSAVINNTTIDSLTFTNTNTASQAGIGGSNNILNRVEYLGSGIISGTNNTIDTLIFFPGNTYTIYSGTNNTITGEWYGSGTPCRLTEIESSGATSATITKTSGEVNFDYVRLQGIAGTGGATYSTQSHSIDQGGNTGWSMAPYDGAAPIYGLGPDTMIHPNDWPQVLRTDGFFGSPSSQYTWGDGSTADTLLITGPGTYEVTVTFPDGCNIADEIVVTEGIPLPITLERFRATLQPNCSGVNLDWSTSSEQNGKSFTILRSTDGNNWNGIGTVAAVGNSDVRQHYSFTDAQEVSGIRFYRLLMTDVDRRQKLSTVLSVKPECDNGKYFVYPNPVNEVINIQIPADGKQKTLAVYNGVGQRIIQLRLDGGSVQTLNTTNWNKGIYWIIITDNGRPVHREKIMKE